MSDFIENASTQSFLNLIMSYEIAFKIAEAA